MNRGIAANLPPFVTEIPELAELIGAEQPELDRLEEALESMFEQFHVNSAGDRGLRFGEELLGLETQPGMDLELRRARVRARLVSGAPMTVRRLAELVEAMSGLPVEILEDAEKLSVLIRMLGAPRNLNVIMEELERVRPYHLELLFAFAAKEDASCVLQHNLTAGVLVKLVADSA